MREPNADSVRGATLGEWRELTADLPDDVPLMLVVPAGRDAWRRIGFDISVALSPPVGVLIEADEGTQIDGSGVQP